MGNSLIALFVKYCHFSRSHYYTDPERHNA